MNVNYNVATKIKLENQLISNRYAPKSRSYLKLNNAQKLARAEVLSKIRDGRYQFSDRCCQLCGGEDFLVVAERDRYSLPVRTVVCKKCSLLMTNPVMRDVDYADFYQNHYTSLYDGFQYSTNEFFENQNAAGKRLHDTIKQHVKLDGKLVAEVGCAAGGILYYLKDFCRDVVGCDYGTEFMKMGLAKGLKLKVGGLTSLREESPDVIIYSHVLEHILDINSELDEIYQILPKNGLLVIDVPGIYNIDKAYGSDFLRYLQNAHLFHFSANTLSLIMAAHGFRTLFVDERSIGVFEKSDAKMVEETIYGNEYLSVIEYLKKVEKLCFWFKIKAYPRKVTDAFLKSFGIYYGVRCLYRKLRSLSS